MIAALANGIFITAGISTAQESTIYLNHMNMSVSLGPSMSDEPFQNVSTVNSLANMIDLPSPEMRDTHSQSSHIWINANSSPTTNGDLEIIFDFRQEYRLKAMHFWNYYTEAYDVDRIDLIFYDGEFEQIEEMAGIVPATGNGNPIAAEYIKIGINGVRYVNARLSGDNQEIDFNNIGFTVQRSQF
jgi:hypothetical protein